MKKVTVYNKQVDALYQDNIEVIIDEIKNGRYKNLVEDIRNFDADGNIEEAEKAKNRLPWFTVSGIMDESQTEKPLSEYSGLITLETEDTDIENAGDLINKIELIPTTFSRFQSTEANKITIIVAVDSNEENHTEAFTQVAKYYETELGVKLDRSWSVITKPCYFSFDPNLYYNSKSEQFKIVLDGGYSVTSTRDNENTNGGPTKNDDIDVARFAKFAKFAHFVYQQKEPGEELANTSTIPEEVYENLPEILKIGSSVFDNQREKDVFLTGAFGVLSGLFNTVKGLYASDETFPNLNFFIVAPPSSGKGAMKYAKILGNPIHKAMINSPYAHPDSQNLLYIPANSSSAVVIRHLKENHESGIVFETEADTLTYTLNQDWGGYSDLIRKSFHHEPITYSRKKDREFIELNQPKLSVILSGTPDQVKSLIHSTENGLFSRIIFYAFEGRDMWRDVAPRIDRLNFKVYFEGLGNEVKTIHDTYVLKPFEFDLTQDQWNALNSQFSEWLRVITTFVHKEAASIIKRLGIVQFRIAMILSILRHYEEGHIEDPQINCSDRDFRTAQLLSNTYLEHGLTMFFKLPGQNKPRMNTFLKRFYDKMPTDVVFTRADAVRNGIAMEIQERTVDNNLKRLVEMNFLIQPEYGKYKKF